MVLKLMLASLCKLLLGPPAFGGRYVLRRDSAAGNGTNTTDVNLAADNRRRVSSTDNHKKDCWNAGNGWCRAHLDKPCNDCGQTNENKYMFCCRKGSGDLSGGTYSRGHGCYQSPDMNSDGHTCSTPFCPNLNGVVAFAGSEGYSWWWRSKSGQTPSWIPVLTYGCWLQWGPYIGTETWNEMNGGYVYGPYYADKAVMQGIPVKKIKWESGANWTLGACDETLHGHEGVGYHGCQNKTKSGWTCQQWTSQSPHTHDRWRTQFYGKNLGHHNFCRNPDGEPTIWCYTTDSNKRWEWCNPVQSTPIVNIPEAKVAYYLAAPDLSWCDVGSTVVGWSACENVARELVAKIGKTPGRNLQAGTWSHVPPGCSIQNDASSGGDWAAHYNTLWQSGTNNGDFQLVCFTPFCTCHKCGTDALFPTAHMCASRKSGTGQQCINKKTSWGCVSSLADYGCKCGSGTALQ